MYRSRPPRNLEDTQVVARRRPATDDDMGPAEGRCRNAAKKGTRYEAS